MGEFRTLKVKIFILYITLIIFLHKHTLNLITNLKKKIELICKEIREAVFKVLKLEIAIGIGEKVYSLKYLHKYYRLKRKSKLLMEF